MLCISLLDKVNEGVFSYQNCGKSPHFHIHNVDVMWSDVDIMWNIVEECGCFVDVIWFFGLISVLRPFDTF